MCPCVLCVLVCPGSPTAPPCPVSFTRNTVCTLRNLSMASGSTGHGLDLVRARLMELFPPNARTGPDEPAIKKLEDLCRRKRSAAVCVLDELAINLGVNGPAQGAEAIRADGEEWRMEPNGVAQPPFQPSSALVGIVKRWNLHLDGRRPCPGRDVAGSKRMAADARYDRRPPPAQRNQELHNSFAQQPVQQPRQPPQPPLEPQPVLRCPDETADDAVAVIQKAKFDLRFRLYAAGALERFRGRPDELKELINEIETAGENADAKNAVCARRGLSLGFFMPAAHCTVIYQVIVTKDGDVRYDLPTETGSAIAHRRLGIATCFGSALSGSHRTRCTRTRSAGRRCVILSSAWEPIRAAYAAWQAIGCTSIFATRTLISPRRSFGLCRCLRHTASSKSRRSGSTKCNSCCLTRRARQMAAPRA